MNVVVVGFTGTRLGMTEAQKELVEHLLLKFQSTETTEVIHGDCLGADSDFDDIAASLKLERFIFPCSIPYMRANTQNRGAQTSFRGIERVPIDPLIRNQQMIDNSDVMIGCPKENKEVARSGTWYTIRRAKKAGESGKLKMLFIVYPDGSIDTFKGKDNDV